MKKTFANLSLNEACKEQHQRVLDKGFDKQNIPTLLMLTVTELSEACEADRKNRHADITDFELVYGDVLHDWSECCGGGKEVAYSQAFEETIKDTFEDEIADAFLRLMDLCGEYNIDIEKHIRMKAEYNKLRQTKHGKAY